MQGNLICRRKFPYLAIKMRKTNCFINRLSKANTWEYQNKTFNSFFTTERRFRTATELLFRLTLCDFDNIQAQGITEALFRSLFMTYKSKVVNEIERIFYLLMKVHLDLTLQSCYLRHPIKAGNKDVFALKTQVMQLVRK